MTINNIFFLIISFSFCPFCLFMHWLKPFLYFISFSFWKCVRGYYNYTIGKKIIDFYIHESIKNCYLFFSCSLPISLVWSEICISSLLVEIEWASSWSSSRVVWFNTYIWRRGKMKHTWSFEINYYQCCKNNNLIIPMYLNQQKINTFWNMCCYTVIKLHGLNTCNYFCSKKGLIHNQKHL